MQKSFVKGSVGALGLLVLLGILIAVNVIFSNVRVRKDLTREQLYTLSSGTKDLLGKLERDVTLKLYYSRSAENLPVPLKQYAGRIMDLLHEYELGGAGHVKVEILDPRPDSDEEEWAQRQGVLPQNFDPLGGSVFYLGLVAMSGAKESAIPVFHPNAEPQIEYLVTRMISEVTAARKPKIGVLTQLPVMGMGGMPYMGQRPREPWTIISELRNQYEVVTVTPGVAAIPEDLNALVVIHPKQLPASALYALDQYVLKGGKLIAFMDPVCVADQETSMDQDMGGMMNMQSDLNPLTKAWGLEFKGGEVVADFEAATRIRSAQGTAERNPAWLSLRPENMARAEIATSSLEFMMWPFAGAFTGTPAEGLTMTPLVLSGSDAGFMEGMMLMMGSSAGAAIKDTQKSPIPLAVRLTGTFKTAFPDGKPADATNPDAAAAPATSLKESTGEPVVVLVGDVDMLYDRFSVQTMDFLGQQVRQLANDNISFAVNLVEQLAGNPALISLRSRGSYERPFEKVLALEKIAQEKWRQEEIKLQEKLQDTQARINELQASKDSSQRFVLSPEQEKEIQAFRQESFETKKQLKDVRKNLRSDIEALGLKLKAANIGLMPALVIAAGLLHGLARRSRSNRT